MTSEAEAEAMMLVYSPVDEMEFIQRILPGSHSHAKRVNITCKVTGIYPLPLVQLTMGDFNIEEDHMEISLTMLSYDVTIHKMVDQDNASQGKVFGCEATVPGTSYLVRQEASSCSCQTLHIKDRKRIWRKQMQLLAGAYN